MNGLVKAPSVTRILLACVFLSLLNCAGWKQYGRLEKSASRYYANGNYDLAVYDCVKALRINPGYEKAQTLISVTFAVAATEHENKIKELKGSSAEFKWDQLVFHYDCLVKLSQAVGTLPGLIIKKTGKEIRFDLRDYAGELEEAKTSAAESHYQKGLRLSSENNVDIQRQAAGQFRLAEIFVPNYKDAASRYLASKRAAVKRMAVIPFENKSGKKWYGALSELITDEIVSDIMNDSVAMEFLEIVSRDELGQVMQEQELQSEGRVDEETAVELGKIMGVHEIVTGQITQIVSMPERIVSHKVKEARQVIIGKKKYVDGEGRNQERTIYDTVYAHVTYYTKTAGAAISGSYRIINVKTAELEKSRSINGKYDFKHEYARFTGDERALSSDARLLVSRDEGLAPVDEEMVNYAAKDLSALLASTLKTYAK